jgi:dienelactone hydrolase
MYTEYLDYDAGDATGSAYVAYDDQLASKNSRRPCVLVAHAWAGQGSFERRIAEKLACLGYVAFAIDLYGKGLRGEPAADNTALIQPFMENRLLLRRRMSAAATAAKAHPMVDGLRLGAIGYCFGGLCVLDLARSAEPGVMGVVSFHGILHAPQLGPQSPITAKVLILHGYDDPLATPDDMIAVARELDGARADWQIHAYGRVGHAFALPGNDGTDRRFRYDGAADRRSWTAMRNFLAETLA